MQRVLLPPHPGLLSALGMAFADYRRDYVQTLLWTEKQASLGRLQSELLKLKRLATQRASGEGVGPRSQNLRASLDLRYRGQSHELNVPFGLRWKSAFEAIHQRRFGYRQSSFGNQRPRSSASSRFLGTPIFFIPGRTPSPLLEWEMAPSPDLQSRKMSGRFHRHRPGAARRAQRDDLPQTGMEDDRRSPSPPPPQKDFKEESWLNPSTQ